MHSPLEQKLDEAEKREREAKKELERAFPKGFRIGERHVSAGEIITIPARYAPRDSEDLLRTVLQQCRPALAIAHPVRSDRRTVGEKFLHDDESVELAASVSSVFGRPGQAEEPGRPELLGERRIVLRQPRVTARNKAASLDFVRQERPEVGAELFGCGRKSSGGKGESSHGIDSGPTE